uniref:Uncharacterized protein n=2 Tax=unclassified Caudoviricetes TaxID=2788787 RepID=A0A8S5UU98_9CAUD|nr:MAG TPA: hypothetical protein [Myoviridae sp. ctGgs6]DAF98019.1 MAG TPA: hypothetical protein [Myoviridae sp. ctUKl33]DAN02444.1 MAG TPA: hypothetical protein [Caudoviricetes sp.]
MQQNFTRQKQICFSSKSSDFSANFGKFGVCPV